MSEEIILLYNYEALLSYTEYFMAYVADFVSPDRDSKDTIIKLELILILRTVRFTHFRLVIFYNTSRMTPMLYFLDPLGISSYNPF